MNTVEILTEARKFVEKGWTQLEFARDEVGAPLDDARDPDAVCFCVEGALRKAGSIPGDCAWGLVRDAVGRLSLHAWNDAQNRKQADVVAAFNRAIEFAKASSEQSK